MTLDEFKYLLEMYEKVTARCDKFNNLLENALNFPLEENHYVSDSFSMLVFPIQAVSNIIIQFLVNMGESKDGAEWFMYEGLDQIKCGGTELEVNKKKYNINSIEDYYNFLKDIKNE